MIALTVGEKKLTVGVVVLLDFPKPECEFSHPVHSSSHPRGRHVNFGGGAAAAEAVRLDNKKG